MASNCWVAWWTATTVVTSRPSLSIRVPRLSPFLARPLSVRAFSCLAPHIVWSLGQFGSRGNVEIVGGSTEWSRETGAAWLGGGYAPRLTLSKSPRVGVGVGDHGANICRGVLDFLECPIYPPYRKNGLLFLPQNCSVVLGPYETRGINLPCKFPVASLREYFVALPNCQITFLVKTDGVRIWEALRNFSAEPQHLMPRYDLLACRTSVQRFRVPDKGMLLVSEGRKGRGFCQMARDFLADTISVAMPHPAWLPALWSKYATVFEAGLGTCRTYVVRHFPFCFPLPWKSQPCNPLTGPAEEAKVSRGSFEVSEARGQYVRLTMSLSSFRLLACLRKMAPFALC